MKRVSITLLEPWNYQKPGTVLPLVDEARAEILIKRKIAKLTPKKKVRKKTKESEK